MPDWLKIVSLPWLMLWTLIGGIWQMAVIGFGAGCEMIDADAEESAMRHRKRMKEQSPQGER